MENNKMLSSLKLTSRTNLGKQETKKVRTILQSLMDSNQSFEFRTPVDWKGLGLLDYCFIVKHPMDLGTVSNKLRDNRYQNVQEVFDDIQLIWDNCKMYNPATSWIHTAAEKLERSFKKMAKNYLPSIAIVVPGRSNIGGIRQDKKPSHHTVFEEDQNQIITYHQKMKFYEKLRHLSPQQIGQVVNEIQLKCPSAFKQMGDDNAQIMVDNLDPKTFRQTTATIESFLIAAQERVASKIKNSQ